MQTINLLACLKQVFLSFSFNRVATLQTRGQKKNNHQIQPGLTWNLTGAIADRRNIPYRQIKSGQYGMHYDAFSYESKIKGVIQITMPAIHSDCITLIDISYVLDPKI